MAWPTFVDVTCPAGRCSAYGVVRRVQLRQVALGVVDMPTLLCAACQSGMERGEEPAVSLWVCDDCTTRYAVGLAACPHCGSGDYRPAHEVDRDGPADERTEDDMPKITVHGGPTNAAATAEEAAPADEATGDVDQAAAQPAGTLGAVQAHAVGTVTPASGTAERPATKSPKVDWVAYVVALGADRDWAEAASTTKGDLQAYGQA